jgi:hypothetical protein
MLQLGLSYRQDPINNRTLQESKDHDYYFLYMKDNQQQELFAIYFSIVPRDRLWNMHQKMFHDIGQRVL